MHAFGLYLVTMDTAHGIFLILHFIGMSSLLGGFLVQMSAPIKTVSRAMVDGAWTALITGVALVGFVSAEATDEDPANHIKFGVKGLILAVIIGLVMQGRKKESIEKANYFAIGALALANIIIAVLWK
jgi:hypothetical protein